MLISNLCCAETWVDFANSATAQFQYAPNLITKHDNSGRVLVVWMREQSKTVTNISRLELHCGSRSYRTTVEGRQATGAEFYKESKADTWHYAFPDSPEMALIDHACYYYQ